MRARNGFLLARQDRNPARQLQLELASALSAPLDYTGVWLTVEWGAATAAPPPGRKKVPFTITIPAGSLAIEDAAQNHFLLEVESAHPTARLWPRPSASAWSRT